MFGFLCCLTRLKSICSKTIDPRKGSNHLLEILVHPVIFNSLTLVTAFKHVSTEPISSSVNFEANYLPISSNSSTPHWSADSMTLLIADGFLFKLNLRQEEEGAVNAAAKSATDKVRRYSIACASKEFERSVMTRPSEVALVSGPTRRVHPDQKGWPIAWALR